MTGQQQSGDFVATRTDCGNVAELHGAAVPRDSLVASPSLATDLGNVIPFVRPRRGGNDAPPVMISPADRLATELPGSRPWLQAVLLVCSLSIHGGLLFAFWQEPQPLPGIGIQPVTVDIVIGDNRPPGASPTPGLQDVDREKVEEVKPVEKPAEKNQVGETREVKPDETRAAAAKAQTVEQAPEQRRELAMVETPRAEIPTVLPREIPPDMTAVIAPPPVEAKEASPQKQPKQQKQKQREAVQPRSETRAASGSGVNGAASRASYAGRVSAHLQRYQRRYPAAAESNGITGIGMVRFSIDASGTVTSVSIVRSTGAQVLDREMTAMVRRASPFPAPLDGQAKTFEFPMTFGLKDAPGSR